MTDVSQFAGSYTEFVRWRDDSGRSGELEGSITVRVENDRVSVSMDDGHAMIGELSAGVGEPIRLNGSGGGAISSGLLYVGEESLILEYEADVNGRVERNFDAWTFHGATGTVMRAGLIRQEAVTIWFEGRMLRE